MKVLWPSNFTVQSAYAYQSRMIAPWIVRLGHEVVVLDIRNGGSSTAQVGNITLLPTAMDPLGNDVMIEHFQRSRADCTITLCDAWGFSPSVMDQVNWYPIVPVDHTPVPPAVRTAIKAAQGVIALSRFGQTELRKVGIEALYLPHGLDPAVWTPSLTSPAVNSAKRRVRLPDDTFIVSFVGVNDSNPSRKGIPELLAAWSLFQRRHPNSLLYLHTTALGNMPIAGPRNGVDINLLLSTFEIDRRSVLMPDEYRLRTGIAAEELADIARASDAFILPSRGEGFGVPLIEFQRAGCPVITTDCASGAELCASGWLIDGELEWGWQNATTLKPGIASIDENLERAYAQRGDMACRHAAANFARDFEIDYVCSKYLAPILTQIAETVVLSQRAA